ncbi:Prefoldin [Delphinella strobiligena]|nr:Prefoldin [Delphinella strobiligena]
MSIPPEALQKLLSEIEQKAAFSQQQISIVKSQMAAKNRETRMLQLTSVELDSLPKDANIYEGVGKMFVASPPIDVKIRIAKESEGIKKDVDNLQKKLDYLETTFKNSKDHLEAIFKNGGR